jgi:hypothetical protein
MPIEIRELVIRAAVTQTTPTHHQLESLIEKLKKEIIEQCTESIQEQLSRVAER